MSVEFVARVSSSDAPEKLMALVNALALERRVLNSLICLKSDNNDIKRRFSTGFSIMVEKAA